ncbi:hypothetical protein [Streptomyces sp. NPDC002889]|uniref:hypothetical protein n=1 Tax=Streptomyces sp. NPDC002889 TaxID=3364669 RepID=UPI0036BF9F14
MRKARWVAAAAGVVLLVAGCSGAKDDKPGTSRSGSSAAPAEAGGSLDAAAATKEIADAATAAGFTEEPSEEDLPASVEKCGVSWQADVKKVADPQKSYDATLAALKQGGWKHARELKEKGSVITALDKGGWTLRARYIGRADTFLVIFFEATDNSAECEKAIDEELAKNKMS